MGKNVRAFTLAELMGVVVILGILAIILVPIVDNKLKSGKNVTCKTQEKSILEAAKNYNSANITLCENKGQTCEVTISTLVSDGYLESGSEEDSSLPINPGTGNTYDPNTKVEIVNVSGSNYEYSIVYSGEDIDSCKG